jgi:uncharacterized protein YkwD
VFGAFLWLSTMALPGPAQSQTSTKSEAPVTPQGAAGTKKATKKPAKTTAWRSFSDGHPVSELPPSQTGEWHHFGEDGAHQNVRPRVSVPRQNGGGARIAETDPRQSLSSSPLSELEKHMWTLVNHDRLNPANAAETKGGHAQLLQWNEKLAAVARAHSKDMMEQGFFDHVDPEGKTPAARINAAGIPWQALGENIATNGEGPGDAEDAFMNEPRFQHNHRSNILSTDYTDVGIGIVRDRRGRYYITQDFIAVPAANKAK